MRSECDEGRVTRWLVLSMPAVDSGRQAFPAKCAYDRLPSAQRCRRQATAFCESLDVTKNLDFNKKLFVTDNGSSFRTKSLEAACETPDIRLKCIFAHRGQSEDRPVCFFQLAWRECVFCGMWL